MKCPRCGAEMAIDEHRKYALNMCYECGYMDGRDLGEIEKKPTNFERLKTLGINETAAFISEGIGIGCETVLAWLSEEAK